MEIQRGTAGGEPDDIFPQKDGYGSDAREAGHGAAALGVTFRGEDASPANFTSQAQFIQPLRLISLHPRREQVAFPADGRDIDPLQLAEDLIHAVGSGQSRSRGQSLMPQQEPNVGVHINRLDLLSQAFQRQAMNARE